MSQNNFNKYIKQLPLWANIFKKNTRLNFDIIKILRTIPLFETLKTRDLQNISLMIYERNYKTNEYLFKEGHPGSAMFIIKDGAVKIEKETEKGLIDLASLITGDFFGELALLNDSVRSASAKASTLTKAIVLFREDLMDYIAKQPVQGAKILIQLAKMTGERLEETNKTVLQYQKVIEVKNIQLKKLTLKIKQDEINNKKT